MNILSLCIIAIGVGCGETEVQTKTSSEIAAVETRSAACDECFCEIRWVSGPGVNVELCGPTGPILSSSPCGPIDVGNCFTISGFYLSAPLNSTDTVLLFCMDENSSFMINVTNGNAAVAITCQKGMQNPQTINESLAVNTRYYFNVDGDCELDTCH